MCMTTEALLCFLLSCTHTMQNGCAFNLFVFHSIATEFIQKLSAVQKAHSQQLSSLCVTFRRKAQDIKRNW